MSSRTSLEARTPQEPTGRCEDTADRLERQRREPPRSRAIENARGILHVEDREMTGTLDRLRVCLPFPHVTAGVSAHRGIGDDPRDGARACLFGELSRLEADEQNLIESRSVSHDAGRRIHRVRGQWCWRLPSSYGAECGKAGIRPPAACWGRGPMPAIGLSS